MQDIREQLEAAIAADRRLKPSDMESMVKKLQYKQRKGLVEYAEKLKKDGPPKTASLRDKIMFAINKLEEDVDDLTGQANDSDYDSEVEDPLGLNAMMRSLGLEDYNSEDVSDLDDEDKMSGYDSSDTEGVGRKQRRAQRLAKKNPEKYKKKLQRIMKKSRRRIPEEYLKKAYYAAKLAARANNKEAANDVILRRGMELNIEGAALRLWIRATLRMLKTIRRYG